MSVLLAMPCYAGQMNVHAFFSIMSIIEACNREGIVIDLLVTHGESAITRGRSNMAAAFLRSGLDTLAFLDADIGISGDDFVRLVRLQKPIRGAAVNLKTLDRSESLSVFKNGKRLTRVDLFNLGWAHGPVMVTGEPVEVDYLGGSVMLIEREVIDTVSRYEAHELGYDDPIAGTGVHLFQEIVKDRGLLSEDYAFCHLARLHGFSVWCDVSVIVSHFEGRVAWRF